MSPGEEPRMLTVALPKPPRRRCPRRPCYARSERSAPRMLKGPGRPGIRIPGENVTGRPMGVIEPLVASSREDQAGRLTP